MKDIKQLVLGLQTDKPREYEAFSEISDQLDYLYALIRGIKPEQTSYCRAYHSIDQDVTTGAGITLAFDSTREQKGRFHDNAINNYRFYIEEDGWYDFGCSVAWDDNALASSFRQLYAVLTRNGASSSIFANRVPSIPGVDTYQFIHGAMFLYTNDYMQFAVSHGDGGTIPALRAADFSVEAWISKYVGGR